MLLALLVLGLFAGILSGLFGIGGGIVMVPAMIVLFNFSMLQANAVSLAAMLLPVGILGVIKYYKEGFIDLKIALIISLGLMIGSGFGAEIALWINVKILEKLYVVFLLYNVFLYFGLKFSKQKKVYHLKTSTLNFIIVGIIAGVIAGMFGKGGGIIIVPFLINFFNFDTRKATATSLAALQLPVGLPGVYLYAVNGQLNYIFAAMLAAGIIIGTYLGTHIAIRIPAERFKKIYALFLIFAAISILLK
ncbi:MAG TPA: sulfite exporter TauE/SafE family protein [Ignavibacteriales bacterium]|nr:sulfite exporter TauE/SafE family protein [Ignavibacteriales bacterium]HOL80527.1 sulfite exporter TauE/SafE family protein [Ignavibacteriales bacterium]HOM64216.1 sulfite exporter TauE/SafE family protein [Ignavibacteriales bacterium]HPD67311.1 sulfite exporter TauE/SafE family protein [Ignavibacteriales bacterium]HPP33137.1 sulfite exporter TauE/SafE family protein [Ignavibacteriales bacterium]